jgi:hypothetical protein
MTDPLQTVDDQDEFAAQANNTEFQQTALPIQPRTALESSKTLQRSPEGTRIDARSIPSETAKKSQARLALSGYSQGIGEAEPAEPDLTETASENLSEELAVGPPQPPLQDAWNVQRMEAPESHEGAAFSTELDQTDEPVVSRAPVEILPPSRPRPAGAQVTPSRPDIQRQPENKNLRGEGREPALVNTAIGPLPSDLWSLLGRQPPVNIVQHDVQGEPAIHSSPAEASSDQEALLHEYTVAPIERVGHTAHLPTMLQRQVEANVPATGPEQESASPSKQDEKDSAEPDLQDLAQKVYAEVRRRLATESERTHRYI